MIDVLMPLLSPTMEEAALARWYVNPGDTVKIGDVIADAETDKATIEVEAVDEGVISEILIPEGTSQVKVHTPIARLRRAGEPAPRPAGTAPAPYLMALPPTPASAGTRPGGAVPYGADDSAKGPGKRIFVSPLARRLGNAAGIDLSRVLGSGPHGRIVRRDLQIPADGPLAAAKLAAPEAAAAPQLSHSAPSLDPPGVPTDAVVVERAGEDAQRRRDGFSNAPRFPLTLDLQIDALLSVQARLNKMLPADAIEIGMLDLLIRASALALTRVPAVNATYTPEGIAVHHHADIAVTTTVDGHLVHLIIRGAEIKGLSRIAAERADQVREACGRPAGAHEDQGGTFSLIDLGGLGIKSFASVVGAAQGAALSVGAGERRPVVMGGQLAIAAVMTVTLTCDHRVMDGANGAHWLQTFRQLMEEPLAWLL